MTALQNQYNELLVEKRKVAETERANRAHEQIQSQQAAAQQRQATAALQQAETASRQSYLGASGIAGVVSSLLTGILKAIF